MGHLYNGDKAFKIKFTLLKGLSNTIDDRCEHVPVHVLLIQVILSNFYSKP